MSETILKKEDYEDSCCFFSTYSKTNAIPIGRVLKKLDRTHRKNMKISVYDVNALIRDNEIRNMHIMEAI